MSFAMGEQMEPSGSFPRVTSGVRRRNGNASHRPFSRLTRPSGCVRFSKAAVMRRDGRVAEGARLESVYTARYPGFESLSLRHGTN